MEKLHELKNYLKQKRGSQTMRDVGEQIGISAAAVLRVEQGMIPDCETLSKICKWLKVSPAYFLEYSESNGAKPEAAQLQIRFALEKVIELSNIIQTAENALAD